MIRKSYIGMTVIPTRKSVAIQNLRSLPTVNRIEAILLTFFIVATSLEARLRFYPSIHNGGAELAICPSDIILVILLLLWYSRSSIQGITKFKLSRIDYVYMVFMLGSAASFITTKSTFLTSMELIRITKIWFLFYYIRSTKGSINSIVLGIVLALIIQTFYSFLQITFGSSLGLNIFERTTEVSMVNVGGFGRAEGTLGHPNNLAQYINLSFFILLNRVLLPGRLSRTKSVMLSLVIALAVITLFVTFSRSGWVSFAIGISIFIFFHLLFVRQTSINFRTVSVFTTGAIVFFIFIITSYQTLTLRFSDALDSSTIERIQLLSIAIEMIRKHPWVGVGLNTFTEVMHKYDTTGISNTFPAPVHNIYILTLAETGTVGLSIFLLLIFVVLYDTYKLFSSTNPNVKSDAIAIFSGLITALASGMLVWGLRWDAILTIFWVLVGLSYNIRKYPPPEQDTRLTNDRQRQRAP